MNKYIEQIEKTASMASMAKKLKPKMEAARVKANLARKEAKPSLQKAKDKASMAATHVKTKGRGTVGSRIREIERGSDRRRSAHSAKRRRESIRNYANAGMFGSATAKAKAAKRIRTNMKKSTTPGQVENIGTGVLSRYSGGRGKPQAEAVKKVIKRTKNDAPSWRMSEAIEGATHGRL